MNGGGGMWGRTFRMRSAASGDTKSGIRRSTLQILRYVATKGVRREVKRLEAKLTMLTAQVFKGRFPNQEFIGKDTKGPIVDFLRMLFPLNHFRGKIV